MFFNVFQIINSSIVDVNLITVAISLVFSIGGGLLLYILFKPRGFDKQRGIYYKSYKNKIHKNAILNSENHTLLEDIKALQIIGEHIQSDDSSCSSFELNLVLKNNIRMNVIDHGNLKPIIKDARIISEFIDVPIWHAKSHH